MRNDKQVTKKPQKKVDSHEKGRKEEGKGGQSAVPCRQRLSPDLAPPDQQNVGIARSGRVSGRALGALKPRGLLAREGLLKT